MLSSILGKREAADNEKTTAQAQAQTKAKILGQMRQAGRISQRTGLPAHRSIITKKFDVTGNDLSGIAILDLGGRDVCILVSESSACQQTHMDLREKINNVQHKIAGERLADALLIAELNNAITKQGTDTDSSDVSPIVNELLNHAIKQQATDIHICCRQNSAMSLLRVHSKLYKHKQFDVEISRQISAYLFSIMAEPRTRSTGTYSLENKSMSCTILHSVDSVHYKLRYKYIRLADGWDVIIRILPLDSDKKTKNFGELGYEGSQVEQLQLSVNRSIGLIAILGPTGSGKSTSLKTMMEFDPKRHLKKRYSVEDPVEYKIHGVSQISIQRDDHENEDDNKQFAGVLRDILRGDPNDVMVGETRDSVTARMVSDFVMTGHKIYTTIHTGSAFSVILRLNRLGLGRDVLADRQFIAALVFQRLMPVLCSHCKVPAQQTLEKRKLHLLEHKFGLNISNIYCCQESGCQHCNGRGFVGSTVVAEVVVFDKVIRQYIADGNDEKAEVYWRQGRQTAFDDANMRGKTAYEHGLYKISQGQIDPGDLEAEFEPFESYEIIEPGDS